MDKTSNLKTSLFTGLFSFFFTFSDIVKPEPLVPKVGSLREFRGSSAKGGIVYFHYNSIHMQHNGNNTFCNKTFEQKSYQTGDPGTRSYQMGDRGLICVSLGVFDIKFGNH